MPLTMFIEIGPAELFKSIIFEYSNDKYKDYQKVICSENQFSINGFESSCDFDLNLEHIMTSEIFIGGDTGTSHFVGALTPGPKDIIYYYSGRGLLHTTPINALNGKGKINFYWKDPENSTWK
jgi:hypothetical protein